MELFLTILVSFYFGWVLREVHAKLKIRSMIEEVEREEAEQKPKDVILIKIEKNEHGFFAYHAKDMMFIANGATRSELEQRLDDRYPGKKFGVHPENLKEIGFTE